MCTFVHLFYSMHIIYTEQRYVMQRSFAIHGFVKIHWLGIKMSLFEMEI